MNIRHARLVKYTSLAVIVYFLFLYEGTEQTYNTDRGSLSDSYVFFLKEILNIPVSSQDIGASEQESSMRTTLASTTSSAMFYSDEEVEEVEEHIGANVTGLDVRKETETFLEDNKLRRANIRFENDTSEPKFIN